MFAGRRPSHRLGQSAAADSDPALPATGLIADVIPVLFYAAEQDADKEQAHDNAGSSQREQNLRPLRSTRVMPIRVIRKFKKVNST